MFTRTQIKYSLMAILAIAVSACTSLPKVQHQWHQFPKKTAFVEVPEKKKFEILGRVRDKIEFPSLDAYNDEDRLCVNYFNKAVKNLVKYSKKNGGDAVIQVRAVTYNLDGTTESHKKPECSDDGIAGQILVRGVAVRWAKNDPLIDAPIRASVRESGKRQRSGSSRSGSANSNELKLEDIMLDE